MPFIRQKDVTELFVGYRVHVICEDAHCNNEITRHVEDCETYEQAEEFWNRVQNDDNKYLPNCLTFVTQKQDRLERLECYQHTHDGRVFLMKHVTDNALLDLQTKPTRCVPTFRETNAPYRTHYFCDESCRIVAVQRLLLSNRTPVTLGSSEFPMLTCCESCGRCL